jgi:integrase
MTTWARQRSLSNKAEGIPSAQAMLGLIKSYAQPRDAALLALLYVSGARISEIVRSLRPSDIEFTVIKNRKVMTITLKNLKNRTRKIKKLPIPLDREGDFTDIIKSYIETRPRSEHLFGISTQRARTILWKKTLTPHFVRHIRLTHLVTMYDFNEQLLIRFAGWTDGRPSKNYMELRVTDLLDSM